MHTLYSTSRYILLFILFLLEVNLELYAISDIKQYEYKGYSILPKEENNKKDIKWSEYMFLQLKNRAFERDIVKNKRTTNNDVLNIYINVVRNNEFDYAISNNNNEITLTASSDNYMLWLIYQFISKISEQDKRINTTDLDPAIITLDNKKKKFDFGYRSIYSSAVSDPDRIAISADQHVDYSWGLWGHNLQKVFKGQDIPNDVMATVDGRKTNKQFCFSSELLYKAIREYIIDSYGYGNDGNKGWFAIIPNDNMEVCTCDKCKKARNTNNSATPAVTKLITRLAEEFKNHNFYTSAYNTTKEAPLYKLPDNAGVIISAIDLPLNTNSVSSDKYINWEKQLQAWRIVTNKVIIWDYMRNFDDYLTPYPCLGSIQNRLKWFKELGIYGVFYNGSGDDYSTFDDLQTFIISSLLKDINLSVKELSLEFLKKHYPHSYKIIFDYYSSIENKIQQNNINLDWYSGIDYAISTYLDVNTFNNFYNELDKISKQTVDEERKRLNMLLTAINFTKLEIIRSGFYKDNKSENDKAYEYIELLKGSDVFSNMKNYKESNGKISEYINSWNNTIFYNKKKKDNITILENNTLSKLTDGYYGFPNDYHLHWVIMNKLNNDIELNINENINKAELTLSFLNATKWKISVPSKIEVYQGNKLIGSWTPQYNQIKEFSTIKAKIELKIEKSNIKIIIGRGINPKIACDEIEIHNIN